MTKSGPKHTAHTRAAFEAERYRAALVSALEEVKNLKEQNEALKKHIAFLKNKRKNEAQQVYALKQQIKSLNNELEEYRKHVLFAAGELRVSLPPPKSEMATVLRAYRQLRYENEELVEQLIKRR